MNEKNQLKEENHTLRNTEMKYQRVRKILGPDVVEQAEQRAIHLEYLEEKQRKQEMEQKARERRERRRKKGDLEL